MSEHLRALTVTIESCAASIQRRYGVKAVHDLRVSIRRIRSILKQDGSPRARRMRKAWGALAAVSNDARDWDVFLRHAKARLSAEDYLAFRRLNRVPVRASREAVKGLLQSDPWRRHLAEWNRYAAVLPEPSQAASRSLRSALDAAGAALGQALDENDEKAWHRLRIALKDVRYVAESQARQTPELAEVIAMCLPLQAALGAWHDSVIQLQLLAERPRHPVHARLRRQLQGARRRSLAEARALLDGQSLIRPRRSAPANAPGGRASPA